MIPAIRRELTGLTSAALNSLFTTEERLLSLPNSAA
jgi:hypothetical protein